MKRTIQAILDADFDLEIARGPKAGIAYLALSSDEFDGPVYETVGPLGAVVLQAHDYARPGEAPPPPEVPDPDRGLRLACGLLVCLVGALCLVLFSLCGRISGLATELRMAEENAREIAVEREALRSLVPDNLREL